MRRKLPLLLVAAFSLTGCAKEINANEAKVVANNILAHQINPDSIEKIKVTYKSTYHTEGTIDRKIVNQTSEVSYKFVLSNKDNYIHVIEKTETQDKIEEKTTSTESEEWIYIRNKVFYKANREKSIGQETKTYSKIEGYANAVSSFSQYYSTYVKEVYQDARGDTYLDLDALSTIFSSEYRTSIQYSDKFYSSGEGNLKVTVAASLDKTDENGKTAKGVGTADCKWDNYLLRRATIAFTLKVTDGTSINDVRTNVSVSHKVSKLIIPTYPNLNKFAQSKLY